MVEYYKQWRTKRGQPVIVEKIKFLGYIRNQNRVTIIEEDGVEYVGEIWQCLMPDGSKSKCVFKEEYIEYQDDVPWEYTSLSDCIKDNTPNALVDPYETVEAFNKFKINSYLEAGSIRVHPNLELLKYQEQINQKVILLKRLSKKLKGDLKKAADLRILLHEAPTLNAVNRWKKISKTIKSNLNHIISYEQSTNPPAAR